ncbi:protein TRC8 homolog [Chrysoperla carnea]|uniref:protein TRC8 homolog n=1 Tax=Chrysoperla carnea TaxID=189513 RepID=UPI001D08520D|nr:protein TRC8 homolog [Chrysoperla carnea]
MSIRTKILSVVDTILRVPPLFVIDELLKIGLGLPYITENEIDITDTIVEPYENVTTKFNDHFHANTNEATFYSVIFLTLLRFGFCCLACMAALCVFTLTTKHLMIVYMYLASVGLIFISYWANVSTVKIVISILETMDVSKTSLLEDLLSLNFEQLMEPAGYASTIIQNCIIQYLLGTFFSYIYIGPRYNIIQKLLPISFMAPSLLSVLPLPEMVLYHTPVFAALLPLAIVKFIIWYSVFSIFQTLYGGYQHARTFITNYGLSALVETEWLRLNVPCVLRTFWFLRALENCFSFAMYKFAADSTYKLMDMQAILELLKNVMVSGCETLTAVLGMASVVSFICHYFGCFFQWILLTEDEDDKSVGTVAAILFYILALQTGLTSLDPEKRFIRLCRNCCLMFTALLHFIHNLVNPLLMSLSASHNPALHKHLRALGVCVFLIVYPLILLFYLWGHLKMSTWLFSVTAFSIEVIVKVCVSLMIYSLFLIDAYRVTFWEKLDDYVYYIRAFGNTVQFMFGIFLLFNGAWIITFESGGAIRAIMMCIHAYFNIWCEAKAGWSVFMKRRTAVNKINSLPEANLEQLVKLNDVCAICYQEMKNAKVTKCKHYFHGVCLRKWLYVQDRCPLCHEILYKVDNNELNKDDQQHQPGEGGDGDEAANGDVADLEDDFHEEPVLDPLLNEFVIDYNDENIPLIDTR